MRLYIRTLTLASLFFAPVASPAQTAADPSGHWEGTIQAPEMETKIEVDLARDGTGALIGTFGQPGEGLTGLPLSDFALNGTAIRFQIKGKPGERAFDGKLSADGKSITGSFTMQGFPMPFSLTRTGDAKIATSAGGPRLGNELVGSWDGTLDVKSISSSYTGAVNGAGTELVGTFSQGAGSVPLTFRRTK